MPLRVHVDYKVFTAADNYRCSKCGATGCKMWRYYMTSAVELVCAECAALEEGKDISSIDHDGCRLTRHGSRTDQIGSYVPAVPIEEDGGWWGYTSVPLEGVKWWRVLPTLSANPRRAPIQLAAAMHEVVCDMCQDGACDWRETNWETLGESRRYFWSRAAGLLDRGLDPIEFMINYRQMHREEEA